MSKPRTMFEKIWDAHVVRAEPGQQTILYIDLHLVHEVTSPQAFEGLRLAGRKVRRPKLTVHAVEGVSFSVGPIGYMMMVVVVLFILGMLMDAVPIMIALAPLLAPIAKTYGISDVHFGLVFVVTCLVGLVTPPVGIILFMTSSVAGIKLEPLAVAVLPFVIWMMIVVVAMVFFPPLTLWLPKLIGL